MALLQHPQIELIQKGKIDKP